MKQNHNEMYNCYKKYLYITLFLNEAFFWQVPYLISFSFSSFSYYISVVT